MQEQILATVRRFVDREVIPAASGLEHRDEYPHALVERLRELGRINIAARAVGVSTAAFAHAIAYAQHRRTFGKGHQRDPAPGDRTPVATAV
jgi:alkylation response protein AidB-like acyl-CoA dehydrogenase